MDYNYVRMRNAKRDGNEKDAERFRIKLDKGMVTAVKLPVLNYIIALLATVSVALMAYIIAVNTVIDKTPYEVIATKVPAAALTSDEPAETAAAAGESTETGTENPVNNGE